MFTAALLSSKQLLIRALFVRAKNWKPPKCSSSDEQTKKMWHINSLNTLQQ